MKGAIDVVDKSLLRHLDIFGGLNDQQLDKIASHFHENRFNEGDIILQENEHSNEMYIIAEGEVEITVGVKSDARFLPSVNGQALMVRLGVGQIFGEMSLVDQGLRSATVRCATSPTRLLFIGRDVFMDLSVKDNLLGFTVMRNIAADVCFKLRSHNLAWK
jgi:CRP-like cAMP-binding protein